MIVDDFSISGGTLIDVALGLKDKGANHIYAALSHNVLSEKGIERIHESSIEMVVTTDTVECPCAKHSNKFKIISAAPMFAQSVKIIHDRTSMSNLFKREFTERMLDMSFAEQIALIQE